MISQWRPVRASFILLLASAGVFIAAFSAQEFFVPDVIAIGAADEPQSLWAVQAAFLLRATENVAVLSAVIVLVALVAHCVGQRLGSPIARQTARRKSHSRFDLHQS
jgi:hypothetical protein